MGSKIIYRRKKCFDPKCDCLRQGIETITDEKDIHIIISCTKCLAGQVFKDGEVIISWATLNPDLEK